MPRIVPDCGENLRTAQTEPAGSDISGFFTRIRQTEVVEFLRGQTEDEEFVGLFERALRVELANASEIAPEDLELFPTDDVGVAQGCPLSAFAGNVALRSFDEKMNAQGITCIRYIDDFILIGSELAAVQRAFDDARSFLSAMQMSIYNPKERPDKAFIGPTNSHFEFLGYRLIPGVYPPATKNREAVLALVKAELDLGRDHILRAINEKPNGKTLQLFAQSLVAIDRVLRAWSGSFKASRCIETAMLIDQEVSELIGGFIGFYQARLKTKERATRRRAIGVHVLADDIEMRLKKSTASSEVADETHRWNPPL